MGDSVMERGVCDGGPYSNSISESGNLEEAEKDFDFYSRV